MKRTTLFFSFQKSNILFLIFFLFSISLFSQEFPLRSKYPTVKTISTKDLADGLGKSLLVVDARNKVEYDAIHIDGAFNDKVGNMNFAKNLEKLTKGNKSEKIVFYCNGGKCKKSFTANLEAAKLGYTNTFSYDAGIFEWAKTYPQKTLLMGKVLNDKSKLISNSEFKAKLLDKEEFEKQSSGENAMLIDVRDPSQREKTPA
ncbi:MAG: rhodanese-like domain-containing protein, partial [Chlorobi bacterium]|nr:rhodanese-like domain-containing protein [Chlorobiota bacterium]